MPATYSDEAIEKCAQLFLKFHGQQHDRIEAEMRKTWPGWSKQNLKNRGKGKNEKIGWIEKYGWEEALKVKLLTTGRQAATSAENLFLEIEGVRERLKAALDAQGGTDRDLVYQHRDYCKLSIDAMARLDAGDNLKAFVAMWEWLTVWLPEISLPVAQALFPISDAILERAKAQFGKA
jgi:hypothetical protein